MAASSCPDDLQSPQYKRPSKHRAPRSVPSLAQNNIARPKQPDQACRGLARVRCLRRARYISMSGLGPVASALPLPLGCGARKGLLSRSLFVPLGSMPCSGGRSTAPAKPLQLLSMTSVVQVILAGLGSSQATISYISCPPVFCRSLKTVTPRTHRLAACAAAA